jgi:hypothetical protein
MLRMVTGSITAAISASASTMDYHSCSHSHRSHRHQLMFLRCQRVSPGPKRLLATALLHGTTNAGAICECTLLRDSLFSPELGTWWRRHSWDVGREHLWRLVTMRAWLHQFLVNTNVGHQGARQVVHIKLRIKLHIKLCTKLCTTCTHLAPL